MGEIIFTVVLILLCILGYNESYSWMLDPDDTTGGSTFWPRAIIIALVVCCIIRIIQILRDNEQLRKKFIFIDLFYGHRGIFLLLVGLYAAGIHILGFLIATILFLNISVFLMYRFTTNTSGSAKHILCRTVCLTAVSYGVYWFFASVLRIMVPAGILGI